MHKIFFFFKILITFLERLVFTRQLQKFFLGSVESKQINSQKLNLAELNVVKSEKIANFSIKNFFLNKIFFTIIIFMICLGCIINNLYYFCPLFYQAYLLKIDTLALAGLSKTDCFSGTIFIENVSELYIFHELEVLLFNFIWKFIFAILMILPVLLIVAYSTLLE